jgi:hypothetical protein
MQPEGPDDTSDVQNTFAQQTFLDGTLGEEEGEGFSPNRIGIRFISRRTRLLDPDNLTPKYLLDGLRYAGLIHDDRAQDITVQTEQEKVRFKAEEETLIEITYIDEQQISDLLDRAKANQVLVLPKEKKGDSS